MSNASQHLGLLLIDLQEGFLKAIPDRERLLRRSAFALRAARLLGLRVAATEQMPGKLGPTSEVLSGLWPEHSPVFEKAGFSALDAPGIEDWIESNRIDHLLLAGIEVPVCIYQTALQAFQSDLGVTLLSDCVSGRREEDRSPVLAQLLAMEAHVLPSETVFYSLLGTAEHPLFREFTKLVKDA